MQYLFRFKRSCQLFDKLILFAVYRGTLYNPQIQNMLSVQRMNRDDLKRKAKSFGMVCAH